MDSEPTQPDALLRRVRYFRKVFAVGIGKRATPLQAAAIDRAARLTARAEQAARDPNINANDLVRLDGCAARARDAMQALLDATKPKRALGPDSLKQYAASKYAGAS